MSEIETVKMFRILPLIFTLLLANNFALGKDHLSNGNFRSVSPNCYFNLQSSKDAFCLGSIEFLGPIDTGEIVLKEPTRSVEFTVVRSKEVEIEELQPVFDLLTEALECVELGTCPRARSVIKALDSLHDNLSKSEPRVVLLQSETSFGELDFLGAKIRTSPEVRTDIILQFDSGAKFAIWYGFLPAYLDVGMVGIYQFKQGK